jgi:negative regulator of flagellin synthesis FlgM
VKINDSIKKTPGLGIASTQTGASKSAEKADAGKTSSDNNVHLSSQLQSLAGQVAGSSVFDTKKVGEIKAAIANGQFQVDAEKVADGLMATVKDLIRKRKD